MVGSSGPLDEARVVAEVEGQGDSERSQSGRPRRSMYNRDARDFGRQDDRPLRDYDRRRFLKGWAFTWDRLPNQAEMRGIPHRDEWSQASRKAAGLKQGSAIVHFGRGEKRHLRGQFPTWPLQCQVTNAKGLLCKKRAAPGASRCAKHCGGEGELVRATRRYLLWVLAGRPDLDPSASPWTDLITIEAVTREFLTRERPIVPDKIRLEAALLLIKSTEWIGDKMRRSKLHPKVALADAGLTPTQVEVAYDALHRAGWLPEVFE